jgi:hypothetical protein
LVRKHALNFSCHLRKEREGERKGEKERRKGQKKKSGDR